MAVEVLPADGVEACRGPEVEGQTGAGGGAAAPGGVGPRAGCRSAVGAGPPPPSGQAAPPAALPTTHTCGRYSVRLQ